jgi:AhpC/TSA family
MPVALAVAAGMALAQPSGNPHGVAGRAQMVAADVDGRAVSLVPDGQTHAVVLFFIASDCPISNRTLPEMKRVQAEFSGRGVQFWYIYPNATETPQSIREHLSAFGVGNPALTDLHERLARMTGAKWTPESAVLVPEKGELRTVYLGRIDDRYLGIGRERPQATQHDLEDAVGAVLAGRKPKPPGGPSVGCGIVGAP